MGRPGQPTSGSALVVVFWSVAFLAFGALVAAYKLGLTSFEPAVSFLVLAGVTGLLSVVFHYLGGNRAGDHGVVALKRIFGSVGMLTLAVWLALSGGVVYFLFREPTKVIRIGVDLPLTGDEGAKGTPILAGMYMGLDAERASFKAATGYDLELVIKNDAQDGASFDAQKGANNIESLITNQNVLAVLGPYNTDVAIKSIPIANRYHTALLSTTTTSNCLTTPLGLEIDAARQCSQDLATEYQKPDRAFFRLTAPNSEIAGVVAHCFGRGVEGPLCPSVQKYSKIVIARDDTTYGAELSVQLAQHWKDDVHDPGNVVISFIDKPINDGELSDDVKAQIYRNAAATDPVLVFFAGTKQLEKLYDNVRQLPHTGFASNSSLTNAKFTKYLDGLAASNPLYASTGQQSIDHGSIERSTGKGTQTGVEDFTRDYQAGYAKGGKLAKELVEAAARSGVVIDRSLLEASGAVSPESAMGYDGARIVIQAIRTAMGQIDEKQRTDNIQKFRQAVVANLHGTEQGSQYMYKGVTGTYIGFEKDGAVKDYTPVSIYEYRRNAQPRWQSQ